MAKKKKNTDWIKKMVNDVNKAKQKLNTSEFFNDLNQCFSNPMFSQSETPNQSNQPTYLYTLRDKNGNIIKQYN